MSHSLGFEVVAEGVDCERQAELLRSMGCDQIQGFLYSPAVPAAEAVRFLAPRGGRRPAILSTTASSTVDRILSAGISEEPPPPSSTKRENAPEASAPVDRVRRRPPATRTLVIDDERSAFGQVALRLMRLGADVHLVHDLDEAVLFVNLDEPVLDLLVVSPSIDLGRLAALREQLGKDPTAPSLRVLVVGEHVDDDQRLRIRQARLDWLVTGRLEDADLRFFIGASRSSGGISGEQRAVRVPVETTAWIRANGERRVGTLTSLSRRGGFVETADDYEIGQSIRLEFKLGSVHVRAFGKVSYCIEGSEESLLHRLAGVGFVFYESETSVSDEIDGIIEQVWSRHLP